MIVLEFYKFDKYCINKGVCLEIDGIYDERLNNKIYIEKDDYKYIQCIFNNNKIADLLKKDFNRETLKYYINFLYCNDMLSIKRMFAKKTIYSRDVLKLILKSSIIFYLRSLSIVFFIPFFVKYQFLDIFFTWSLFIITVIFHEIGHIYTYHLIQSDKGIYINIDKFKFEVVVNINNDFNSRLVSLIGPISGALFSFFLYIIIRNTTIIIFIIFHVILLFPFFQDGKILWNIKDTEN